MTCKVVGMSPLKQEIEELKEKYEALACEKATDKVIGEMARIKIRIAVLEGKKDYVR